MEDISVEYGESPSSLHIQDVVSRRPSGRVLDVGCGIGRNSLYLARQGYTVEALDIDESALRSLAKRATEINVCLELISQDIATFKPQHDYDIVLADRSLYFLPSYESFKSAVLKLQEATVVGGVHSNTILSEENNVDPGPRLVMGRYSMFNLYTNNPQWVSRHEWRTTDPLDQKFITLIAQKIG